LVRHGSQSHAPTRRQPPHRGGSRNSRTDTDPAYARGQGALNGLAQAGGRWHGIKDGLVVHNRRVDVIEGPSDTRNHVVGVGLRMPDHGLLVVICGSIDHCLDIGDRFG